MPQVDLRVRGGAAPTSRWATPAPGRSPRARRSLAILLALLLAVRSISACAEEPAAPSVRPTRARVDLRVRGGAAWSRRRSGAKPGRSPRARRSLLARDSNGCAFRSISACAEEPGGGTLFGGLMTVDLRVRGGAILARRLTVEPAGRSPRARRSPAIVAAAQREKGSISACAEEPVNPLQWPGITEVDLRVRGGAYISAPRMTSRKGRSPRARRSRRVYATRNRSVGSISACAEEPKRTAPQSKPQKVDLRVRGGARNVRHPSARATGRSPRARRSLERSNGHPFWDGSISACAEEPRSLLPLGLRRKVDLRVRGGASSSQILDR